MRLSNRIFILSLASIAAVFVLFAVACGGGDDNGDNGDATATDGPSASVSFVSLFRN